MKPKDVYFNLGCLLSICHLEKAPIRGSLFEQKLLNYSPTLIIWVKILDKYRLISLISFLTSLRISLKLLSGEIVINENDNFISLYGTNNQQKSVSRLLQLLKVNLQRRNIPLSALIKGIFVTTIISIQKRRRFKYLMTQNTNCLTEVIKFVFFSKVLEYSMPHLEKQHGIIANDHSAEPLAFAQFLRRRDIKITLLQHAHVSDSFPALFRYDLAILYGEKSKQIYLNRGKGPGKILLSGYKFESAVKLKGFSDKMNVAIFPNIINENKLNFLILRLNQNSNIQHIYIKPHPAHEVPERIREKFLHSGKVTILKYNDRFIDKIDLGISGNSSMHIELLAQGVPTIYYDYLDDIEFDYYGFVRDRVVLHLKNLANLTSIVLKDFYGKKEWQQSIAHFDSSFKDPVQLNEELEQIKNYFLSSVVVEDDTDNIIQITPS